DGARAWGAPAIELAERLGETETLVHALHNVGVAELYAGAPEGAEKVARSLANLGAAAIRSRDYRLGDRHLAQGIEYARERDLDSWLLYMTGWRSRPRLDRGRWGGAPVGA